MRLKHGPRACRRACPELAAIDSLMWQQPDSALAVLLNYLDDDSRDAARHVSTNETFDNHYAQLLTSELLFKNDYAQTNRTELLQAVAYFDSLLVMTDGADTLILQMMTLIKNMQQRLCTTLPFAKAIH